MSRVTNVDKNQGHDNAINNTSNTIPRQSRSNLNTIINEVRQEFRKQLVKRKELIIRLGDAFESVGSNPESICKKIKNRLHQEIVDKIITARDIERYCPDKWKKKTKPKNDNLSFSKQEKPQQQIAVMEEGKSAIISNTETIPTNSNYVSQPYDQSAQNEIGLDDSNETQMITPNQCKLDDYNRSVTANETTSNTKAYNNINQPYDQSKQNGIGVYGNSETQTIQTNQGKLDEPKANIETSTVDNYSSSHTVEKITSDRSDKQECSHQITIPREKYRVVTDAMDKSEGSILVKFDGNNRFLSADPDVYNGIPFDSGANHQDGNVQAGDHTYCERCWRGIE